MRVLLSLAAVALVAGAGVATADQPRSAKAEARLQQALAGKQPGAPVSCLPPGHGWQTEYIDDNTILFRRGSKIYRNDPPGGCSPIGSGHYALLTKTSLSSLCSSDIARVIDTSIGMTVGSCGLGPFVPYR